jgi:molybdate transport repressor ModE-like protein
MSVSMPYVIDPARLRTLLAIQEYGSIAAAARALAFTPPAVSQQIAALERQLGVELLNRDRRTARLTGAGTVLAAHAEQILAQLEAAEADLTQARGNIAGHLTIGVIPTIARTLLPAALSALRAAAPALDAQVHQMEPEDSLRALRRGDLDAAVAAEYQSIPQQVPAGLQRHDLFTEPVLLAVPAGHLPDHATAMSTLAHERWIAPKPGTSCFTLLERSSGIAGFTPHTVATCDDFSVTLALVGAGHGIALLPESATALQAPELLQQCQFLQLTEPATHRTIFTAIRSGTSAAPPITRFLDTLTSQLAAG